MLDLVRRVLAALLVTLLLPVAVVATAPAAHAELENFSSYQPEERCSPKAKAGAEYLAGWLVRTYGGARGRIGAACTDSVSEHQEGRAVDWSNDAATKAGRARVKASFSSITPGSDDFRSSFRTHTTSCPRPGRSTQ